MENGTSNLIHRELNEGGTKYLLDCVVIQGWPFSYPLIGVNVKLRGAELANDVSKLNSLVKFHKVMVCVANAEEFYQC